MKLSELLVNLRKDLDKAQEEKSQNGIDPKYKIDKITVELLTENFNSIQGGVGVSIAKVGGSAGDKNYHKIIIVMSPKHNH